MIDLIGTLVSLLLSLSWRSEFLPTVVAFPTLCGEEMKDVFLRMCALC